MSYSYMICADDNKKCQTNKMNFDKYFDYLKTLDNDDSKLDKLNEYVCNGNKGNIMECCDPNDDYVVNEKYIKKVDNGYQICKCKNEKCKNIYCKDFKRPSKYQLCKVKSNNNKKINNYVNEINNNDLMPDCFNSCN